MEASEQSRFDTQYKRHLRALKLQGLSDSTIDAYSPVARANVRESFVYR